MSVQNVQDNGLVNGALDLSDHITIQKENGQTNTITVENYLAATSSAYDGDVSPNKRLANVLRMADRLPVYSAVLTFLNTQTESWNKSHPAAVASGGESESGQCPQGTTLVTASGSVTGNFCIDNEATQKVKGQNPTWSEAKGFCETAGKFLLTYEQHKLGAKSTDSSVVRNSGDWEWVLKSNGDNSEGQVGGFFFDVYVRHNYNEGLGYGSPVLRHGDVAFRCGEFPRPRTDL